MGWCFHWQCRPLSGNLNVRCLLCFVLTCHPVPGAPELFTSLTERHSLHTGWPHSDFILVEHRLQSRGHSPPSGASPGQPRGSRWPSGPRSARQATLCLWKVTCWGRVTSAGLSGASQFGELGSGSTDQHPLPGSHPALSPAALRFPLWRGAEAADSLRTCSPGKGGDPARPRGVG